MRYLKVQYLNYICNELLVIKKKKIFICDDFILYLSEVKLIQDDLFL